MKAAFREYYYPFEAHNFTAGVCIPKCVGRGNRRLVGRGRPTPIVTKGVDGLLTYPPVVESWRGSDVNKSASFFERSIDLRFRAKDICF